jgi:hypothetical protein
MLTAIAVLLVSFGVMHCVHRYSDSDVQVSGRIWVDGQPIKDGIVVYRPDRGKGNSSPYEPRGRIDSNGWYSLESEGRKGAAAGWYRVTVFVLANRQHSVKRTGISAPGSLLEMQNSLSIEVRRGLPPGGYDLGIVSAGYRN